MTMKSSSRKNFSRGSVSRPTEERRLFLTVHGTGGLVGRTEMRPIIESDLEAALGRDRVFVDDANASEAALSPLGDLK